MNVLVIAPHPDDEAIGCGGTICRHADTGDRVEVAFLTSGELGLKRLAREQAWAVREAEARAAAQVLGVASTHFLRQSDWLLNDSVDAAAAALAHVIDGCRPERIYLPHPADGHPDHRASIDIIRAGLRACAGGKGACELWAYEIWSPLPECDRAQDVTACMARKLAAVRCYRSQLEQYRYDHAIRGLNRYRGALGLRRRYAEAFLTVTTAVGAGVEPALTAVAPGGIV